VFLLFLVIARMPADFELAFFTGQLAQNASRETASMATTDPNLVDGTCNKEMLDFSQLSSFVQDIFWRPEKGTFRNSLMKSQSATVSVGDSVQRKKTTDKNARLLKKQNVPICL
jgi:hypothetical protein